MMVPKASRDAVYKYLFSEGVLVAPKDDKRAVHSKELNVSNLIVCKLMLSFKSRGFVRENFNWQCFYWYLTDAGINYLREYLHLPADQEIVPATMKRTNRPVGVRPGAAGAEQAQGGRPAGRGFGGKRPEGQQRRKDDGYRREGGGFGRGSA